MTPRRKGNEGGRPCLTALTAFASSDLSMTASSETEGTISCGGASLTVVAILFYQLFFWSEEIEMRRRTLWHPRDQLVGDKARDFTIAAS